MASLATPTHPTPRAATTPATRALLTLPAMLLSLLLGCSSEPMDASENPSSEKVDSENTVSRVIVTLDPSVVDMEAAVTRITAKFPQAKVLRTMESFSQLVIELPSTKLDALTQEKIVRSTKIDQTNKPMQNTP